MAGTDDNILGGQDAVIRVGVEADMSDILEQANKFNELIKDANDSFNAMQTVITSTTTRMASLNSATLRLVSSARQLRNEYQLIAESSQRIGFLGGVRGGDAESLTGIGGGSLLGVTSPSGGGYVQNESGFLVPEGAAGISGSVQIGEQYPGIGAGLSSAGQAGGAVSGGLARTLDLLRNGANPPSSSNGSASGGGVVSNYIGKHSAGGYVDPADPNYIGRHAAPGALPGAAGAGGNAPGSFFAYLNKLVQGGAGPGSIGTAVLGRALGAIPGVGAAINSATLAAAAPYIMAVLGAGVAAYKAVDYAVKGATKYTGLTGGTGVFSSQAEGDYTVPLTGGLISFNRGSFIGLQAQKWISGLTNMAVGPGGYGEIQEGLLTAGYKPYGDEQATNMGMQGMRYDQTRATLASLYAKGYQDVGANIALMQISLESAGTSTAAFTSAMDALRVTAQKTNASMKGLTAAFTTAMKALSSGMGANGNWTTLFAQSYAGAYANSRNAALRNGGAVADLSQFGPQVFLMNTPAFQQAGITFQNSLMAYSNSPGMAETLAMGTDQMADQLLRMIGIGDVKGMNAMQVETLVRNKSPQVMAIKQFALAQGLIGADVANDTNAFIEWLVSNATGDPVYGSLVDQKRAAGSNYIKHFRNAEMYFSDNLMDRENQSRGLVSDFLKASSEDKKDYSVLNYYYNYVNRTHKSIGWLESITGSRDQSKTWVNYRDQQMKLTDFLKTYGNSPEVMKLIESGNLQIATSKDGKAPDLSQFSAAYNTGTREVTVQDATLPELQTTFTEAMKEWASQNNGKTNGLKVSVDLPFG